PPCPCSSSTEPRSGARSRWGHRPPEPSPSSAADSTSSVSLERPHPRHRAVKTPPHNGPPHNLSYYTRPHHGCGGGFSGQWSVFSTPAPLPPRHAGCDNATGASLIPEDPMLSADRRLGFAVKVLGREGLKSHDTRRWQSGPSVAVSI